MVPGTDTMDRLVHAAGFRLEPGVVRGLPDPADRAQELLDVLDLAEHFPARHAGTLTRVEGKRRWQWLGV